MYRNLVILLIVVFAVAKSARAQNTDEIQAGTIGNTIWITVGANLNPLGYTCDHAAWLDLDTCPTSYPYWVPGSQEDGTFPCGSGVTFYFTCNTTAQHTAYCAYSE